MIIGEAFLSVAFAGITGVADASAVGGLEFGLIIFGSSVYYANLTDPDTLLPLPGLFVFFKALPPALGGTRLLGMGGLIPVAELRRCAFVVGGDFLPLRPEEGGRWLAGDA